MGLSIALLPASFVSVHFRFGLLPAKAKGDRAKGLVSNDRDAVARSFSSARNTFRLVNEMKFSPFHTK